MLNIACRGLDRCRKDRSMGKIIAFANQKGGVGKTTSAVNVAASLGVLGKKTLLVDLDPQGNATSGVGIAKKKLKRSVRDLLLPDDGSGVSLEGLAVSTVVATDFDLLSVIPSTIALAGAEFDLFSQQGSEYALRKALNLIRDDYDFIVIDCPPSLGMLTVEGLAASDGIVVPMQCEFYSLEGLSQLMITTSRIKQRYNPALAITGILLTMYNPRLVLTAQVEEELRRHYGSRLFQTKISRGVRLTEAPSFGLPVYYHDRQSKGAREYLDVAAELIRRN